MAVGVTIRHTIPDNEARTAFTTLRRLGVEITALERADLYLLEADPGDDQLSAAFHGDESIFNENLQALAIRRLDAPAEGEVWVSRTPGETLEIDGLGRVARLASWTMRVPAGTALDAACNAALGALLCNPVIEHSVTDASAHLRDAFSAKEEARR